MRSRCGVELNCSAPKPQWWFVTMSPSGDTNEALQPPSEITAPIGSPVRSAKRCASIFSPSFCSSGASCGICCGIHIPSAATSGVAARESNKKSFFT